MLIKLWLSIFKGWMQPCTDTDLKTNIISSQECELQDLSNQNSDLRKILNKFNKKVTKLENP